MRAYTQIHRGTLSTTRTSEHEEVDVDVDVDVDTACRSRSIPKLCDSSSFLPPMESRAGVSGWHGEREGTPGARRVEHTLG